MTVVIYNNSNQLKIMNEIRKISLPFQRWGSKDFISIYTCILDDSNERMKFSITS
jgi:hypothetical protein